LQQLQQQAAGAHGAAGLPGSVPVPVGGDTAK